MIYFVDEIEKYIQCAPSSANINCRGSFSFFFYILEFTDEKRCRNFPFFRAMQDTLRGIFDVVVTSRLK